MKTRRSLIILGMIFTIAFISVFFFISGMANRTTLPSINQTNTSVELVDINPRVESIPPDIRDEIRTLSREYVIPEKKWGFDPFNLEINLYSGVVLDENVKQNLNGKKIGNFTIRIYNDTEILNAQQEVFDQLFQLRKDPDYQITHVSMNWDPTNNPPEYNAEILCYGSTPANRKIENLVIKGWRIHVNVCCSNPDSTNVSPESTNNKS